MRITNLIYFLLSKISRKKVFWEGFALANGFDSKDCFNLYRKFFKQKNNSLGNGFNPSEDVFFKEGYLVEYPDVEESGADPWIHYVKIGKQEGRDNGLHPSVDVFYKEGYLAEYPDVEESGADPWVHYVKCGKKEGRDNGLHPSEDVFYKDGYLAEYPDVEESGADPWRHYAECGKQEGRDNGHYPSQEVFDSFKYYLMFLNCNILPSVTWKDYVQRYAKKYRYATDILVVKNSVFFDEDWYKANYSEIDFSKITPAEHYLYEGWKQGKSPSLDFSTNEYLSHYPDLKNSDICPLVHFEKSGRLEGRSYWADINEKRNGVAKALKKDKSVLLISHELSHTGAPLSLIFAAKILKNEGYSVAVLSLCEGKLLSEYEKLGIPCYVTRTKGTIELLASLSNVVIVNTLVCYEYYELCARVAPTIWWVRESPEILGSLGYCEEVLTTAKNVYAMSDYSRSQFLAYNDDIKVIKHGLDDCYAEAREKQRASDGKIMFSFLGSYNQRKGIDVLLMAINNLPDEVVDNCVFFFAGNMHENNEYVAELRKLIEDKRKDKVIFHDSITDKDEIEEVFYKSSCFIVPSREEPTSRVVIEAMMHGRPCIISDHVGASYLINEDTGLIFSNESSEELLSCITKIYESLLNDRECYFKNCRQTYIENNSVEKYTANLLDSIKESVSNF